MKTSYAIKLENIQKKFNDFTAVEDFNVEIKKGEFFSLLGPSGCGKTTTLRMIAGLEEPTTGNIMLESEIVNNVPPYKRHVNTVFQDYALFPHMTVKKNIYFPLKMKKIPLSQAEPMIKKVLQLVNMEEFGSRLPQQLSGGQRQRIALARSLVNEPAALLLDEPLGALDFKLRIAMQKVLKDIQQNVGITFIYVTHDQTEAMTMSDRIAVMKDGRVHQIGNPDQIYNSPATAFVASFIGDMNFIHGIIIFPDKHEAEADGNAIKYCNEKSEFKKGQNILICIRTEKVQVNTSRKVDNSFDAELIRIIFRGVDFELTFNFCGAELRSIVSSLEWDQRIKTGTVMKIGWNSEDVIVYPAEEEGDIVKYSLDSD